MRSSPPRRRSGTSSPMVWIRPPSTSMLRPVSPMDTSSGWAPRSGTRPRSCTRAGRSGAGADHDQVRRPRQRADQGVVRSLVSGSSAPSTRPTSVICFSRRRPGGSSSLDLVLLMVTGRAPHKEIEDDPGAEVRLEMARRGGGEDGVEASDLEVGRRGVLQLPDAGAAGRRGSDGERFFLLGADMAAGLASWRAGAGGGAGAARGGAPPGVGLGAVRSALERLGAADRAEIIDMPLCGASSTTVRERAREGSRCGIWCRIRCWS